jgi:hypothetical protein
LAEATKKVLWVKSARILEAWSLSFATCPNNSSPELGGILVVVSQRIIKVLVNSVPVASAKLLQSKTNSTHQTHQISPVSTVRDLDILHLNFGSWSLSFSDLPEQ